MKLALEVLLSGKRPYLDLPSEELGARLRVELQIQGPWLNKIRLFYLLISQFWIIPKMFRDIMPSKSFTLKVGFKKNKTKSIG